MPVRYCACVTVRMVGVLLICTGIPRVILQHSLLDAMMGLSERGKTGHTPIVRENKLKPIHDMNTATASRPKSNPAVAPAPRVIDANREAALARHAITRGAHAAGVPFSVARRKLRTTHFFAEGRKLELEHAGLGGPPKPARGPRALVRLRAHWNSRVQVPDLADTVRPIAERNCIGATPPGGEQREANDQSVTRSRRIGTR